MQLPIKIIGISLLALFAVLLVSCNSGKKNQTGQTEKEDAKTEATAKLMGVRWEPITINGNPIKDMEIKPFMSLATVEGGNKVKGYLGCNKFFGPFTYSNNGELKFGAIGSTKRLCEDMSMEKTFSNLLGACASYKIKGSHLHLYDKSGEEIATFEAK